MFAYCGNNPVTKSDATGHFWGIAIRVVVAVAVAVVAKNHVVAKKNYKSNAEVDANPQTTTKNKIVNDQYGTTGEQFTYGRHEASWNACETIAVHNAKVLEGKESTLSETMRDFQILGAMPLCGYYLG